MLISGHGALALMKKYDKELTEAKAKGSSIADFSAIYSKNIKKLNNKLHLKPLLSKKRKEDSHKEKRMKRRGQHSLQNIKTKVIPTSDSVVLVLFVYPRTLYFFRFPFLLKCKTRLEV